MNHLRSSCHVTFYSYFYQNWQSLDTLFHKVSNDSSTIEFLSPVSLSRPETIEQFRSILSEKWRDESFWKTRSSSGTDLIIHSWCFACLQALAGSCRARLIGSFPATRERRLTTPVMRAAGLFRSNDAISLTFVDSRFFKHIDHLLLIRLEKLEACCTSFLANRVD